MKAHALRRAIIAVALCGLIACSGDDKASTSADQEQQRPAVEDAQSFSDQDGRGSALASGSVRQARAGQAADGPEARRDVVRTAKLRVRAGDVPRAAGRAVDVVEAAGGVVFDQNVDLQGDTQATLTLKVPPAKLDETVEELSELGTVLTRSENAEDVTEQVVDLDSRLKSARASADRLRTLLGTAATANDVVSIERELAQRESQAESLDAQLRSLRSRVDMATIELAIVEKGEVEVSDDIPGFLDGLRGGWVVLVNAAKVGLAVIGALLPFVLPVALVWLLVWTLRRRRRGPDEVEGPGQVVDERA